jgi:hypothetical protein
MKAYTIYLGLITRGGEYVRRLFTPEKLLTQLTDLLTGYDVEGATVIGASGFWRGEYEPSLTIYVCAEDLDQRIESLCAALAHDFDQVEVGYHESPALTMVANPTQP